MSLFHKITDAASELFESYCSLEAAFCQTFRRLVTVYAVRKNDEESFCLLLSEKLVDDRFIPEVFAKGESDCIL